MAARRSLSLTRSSASPCRRVVPLAQDAATARIGYSSIMRGARSAGTSTPASGPASISIQLAGSAADVDDVPLAQVRAHLDEGLQQAGAQRVDADALQAQRRALDQRRRDQGKGGRRDAARHLQLGRRELGLAGDRNRLAAAFAAARSRPSRRDGAAAARCDRARPAARPPWCARRMQAGEQDRGLDLGGGDPLLIADRQQLVAAGDRERQAAPLRVTNTAPICASGSLTRAIGRERSESSPVMKAVKGCPARRPNRRRAPVPELPRSSGRSGSARPPTPTPSTCHAPSARRSTATPRSRSACAVASTSAPSSRPRMLLSPTAIAASISTRCEIDLSPGTVVEPLRRRTG